MDSSQRNEREGTSEMAIKSIKKLLFVLSFCALGVLLLWTLTSVPRLIDQLAGYQDVFSESLPTGITIKHEFMYAPDLSRSVYTYYLLLHGNKTDLMSYINMLGLKEENLNIDHGSRYMNTISMRWWTPPSLATGNQYHLFQKKVDNLTPDKNYRIQVELINEEIYLVKLGDLKSLRNKINKKGGVCRLF